MSSQLRQALVLLVFCIPSTLGNPLYIDKLEYDNLEPVTALVPNMQINGAVQMNETFLGDRQVKATSTVGTVIAYSTLGSLVCGATAGTCEFAYSNIGGLNLLDYGGTLNLVQIEFYRFVVMKSFLNFTFCQFRG
jgi:hypothetical protein